MHQIFFAFPPERRRLEDFPLFVESSATFKAQEGWKYKLWGLRDIIALIRRHCPAFEAFFRQLRHDIQRVDVAKYLIGHYVGGVVSDLDVFPLVPLDAIVRENQVLADVEVPGRACNDFFYSPKFGLPGLLETLEANLARLDAMPFYQGKHAHRYVLQSTGPSFWTRYLKERGLSDRIETLSRRYNLNPEFNRPRRTSNPMLLIVHHGTWVANKKHQAALAKAFPDTEALARRLARRRVKNRSGGGGDGVVDVDGHAAAGM